MINKSDLMIGNIISRKDLVSGELRSESILSLNEEKASTTGSIKVN